MDYKKFAESWGIKDDDTTRQRIIHHNWDDPGYYSSRLLLGIGEVETAKQMALRAAVHFEDSAAPLAALYNTMKNEEETSSEKYGELLLENIEKFAHFRHHLNNLAQSNFRGTAINALIKLNQTYKAKSSSDEWSFFIDNSESPLYDPSLYNELVERFPELARLDRYRTLYEQGDCNTLLDEFPERKIPSDSEISINSFQRPSLYGKEVYEEQFENQEKYFDDLVWFAGKMVECYGICQTCPEYQRAKTEEIMVGIRALVQKLLDEQLKQEGE